MKLTTLKFPGFVLVMLTVLLSSCLLVFGPSIARAAPISFSDILQVTFDGSTLTRTLEEVRGESVTDNLEFTFTTGSSDFKNNSVFLVEPGTVIENLGGGLVRGHQSDVVTLHVT